MNLQVFFLLLSLALLCALYWSHQGVLATCDIRRLGEALENTPFHR